MSKAEIISTSLTLDNIMVNFNTDEKAREFLEHYLWADGPVCPRCKGNDSSEFTK